MADYINKIQLNIDENKQRSTNSQSRLKELFSKSQPNFRKFYTFNRDENALKKYERQKRDWRTAMASIDFGMKEQQRKQHLADGLVHEAIPETLIEVAEAAESRSFQQLPRVG